MNKGLGLLVILPVLFGGMVSYASKKERPCYLNLVSSQATPQEAQQGSSENHRFLSLVRDLKSLGVEFSALNQDMVLKEFKSLSAQNLSAMLENYRTWLVEQGREIQEIGEISGSFFLTRNQPALAEGFENKVLETHREATLNEEKHKTIWSTVTGGFDGVLFQIESFETAEAERVYAIPRQGMARLHLVEDFDLSWSYVLPLPGARHGSYQAHDFRFLSFVRVFAPGLFRVFLNDLRGHSLISMDEKSLFRDEMLFDLSSLNSQLRGFKVLQTWKADLKDLILTAEDGARLLAFIKAQQKTSSAPVLSPEMDNISSLSVVISGRLGPKDYVVDLGADPYVASPPTPLKGLKVNPRPFGLPNLTGDGPLIPTGPNKL